ncbi:MAG: hypothetical protein KF812_12525 [Fimbriimonadaceae bacterium]|nr:hypothetical protein [Fimbriimonadaceae bacterium]
MKRESGSSFLDSILSFLDGFARILVAGGGLALIIGLIFLLMSFFSGSQGTEEQILRNVDLWGRIAFLGAIVLSIGGAYILYEEETAGPIALLLGAAMAFAPSYMGSMGNTISAETSGMVLGAIQKPGLPLMALGIFLLAYELISRARVGIKQGAKADQLKLGQGLKEEREIKNVFMGKCWQLPYCRKFVRERCPIYHAKRTCWKERTGCMCEESVINNAMKGTVIPKDIVAAAQFIPRNNKLTEKQKAERCMHCVIYNEHQKHKYKLGLPIMIAGIAVFYVLMREPMAAGVARIMNVAEGAVNDATFNRGAASMLERGIPFHEIVLGAIMIMVMAYGVKLLEYFIFRMKV